MNKTSLFLIWIISTAAGLGSCSKKTGFTYDNRPNPSAFASSSIRIVNLRNATELMVNGEKLTSFTPPNIEGFYDATTTKGTSYFPETGRLGLTYTIPQHLVDAQGMATGIRFAAPSQKGFQLPLTRSFQARDDYYHPLDYYFTFYTPNQGGLLDSLFAVPRSVSPPADPRHFKLRLLNLSSTIGPANNVLDQQGPMSLAWSDGTQVSPVLSGIPAGAWSEYVELPYGSYQFRVLTGDGVQVPGVGGSQQYLNIVYRRSGTIMLVNGTGTPLGGMNDSHLSYAPLKTFQPGGVYTIAVADCGNFKILTGGVNGETLDDARNAFRIIEDIPEPVNQSYARIQAVNFLPASATNGTYVSVTIDGMPLSGQLGFTGLTEYSVLAIGDHVLKVSDAKGNLLASKTIRLSSGDNITAWAFPGRDGKVAVAFSANNLAGVFYTGQAVDDGSYSMLKNEDPFWMRFLNFCPDLSEVSFTGAGGVPFTGGYNSASATQHILFGTPVTESPYIMPEPNAPVTIWPYASQPMIFPGDWLRNIPVLAGNNFISNPGLYPDGLPNSEPGVYTVALAGSLKANAPASEKARMVIIKHNR